MACLLETNDVVCIYNDNHFRVTSANIPRPDRDTLLTRVGQISGTSFSI